MSTDAIGVTGFDPSMNNWGVAQGVYSPSTGKLQILNVDVIQPILPTGKQIRQNSKDLEAAKQLAHRAAIAAQHAQAIFVEVPVGSQSARAMASYGICVGVLGALRASGTPFFEVSPTEVKLAGAGKKTATKQDMIEWAVKAHPEANWPMYQRNGQTLISEAKAEHMADAIAAIYAGLQSTQFQQVLPFLKQQGVVHADSTQPA
ncbi:MAG: hypothetical protein KC496_00220 [Anaerolineae bacterium]|nr:hypothetical protein [Anaerolineae bacterium]